MTGTTFISSQCLRASGLLSLQVASVARTTSCSNYMTELAEGLAAAIARLRALIALERQLATAPDDEGLVALQLHGEEGCFARFRITPLDDLEIDYDTHEYRVNGGEWHYALSADCGGVESNYPRLVDLTDEELGTLAPIVRSIRNEAGIAISIARIVYY